MSTVTTEARDRPRPDWRDPATYAYTQNLTREGWAWEFLRRNPKYRADYSRIVAAVRSQRPVRIGVLAAVLGSEAALRWGLLPF